MATITGSTPGKIRTFLLDHERLLIVVLFAALCWWGYGKYADIRANDANVELQKQVLITKQDAAVAQAQAAQAATDAQQLKALQDQLQAQSVQIAQQQAQLKQALADRQKTDATLPLPELATRWTALVPLAVPVATPQGVTVTPAGAVATVQALEEIPEVKSELVNETTLKTNDDKIIAQQTTNITDLTTQVTGLKTLNAADAKQCTDEKNQMKAEFRKSKRHWFIAGTVVGWAARQVVKTYTGW
jgi:multidrug efflux pump subunit AcrA (membrane-fusion protein)